MKWLTKKNPVYYLLIFFPALFFTTGTMAQECLSIYTEHDGQADAFAYSFQGDTGVEMEIT